MTVQGKHVIVSGGGSGVGAAIAHAYDKAGANVTIIGRTPASLARQKLAYQVCDVTERAAVADAYDEARRQFGPISLVVANAGAAHSEPFAKMSNDSLQQMLSVNLGGVFNTWQLALNDMQQSQWGRLIAIASTAGLKGYPYVTAYCAAKHAVIGMTRSLAIELASTGITVNAICPGFTDTPLLQRSIENIADKTGMSADDASHTLLSANPQGRFIDPDEVAATTLWLASDAARSINGHALSISGGEI